jgi:hypothetical protein
MSFLYLSTIEPDWRRVVDYNLKVTPEGETEAGMKPLVNPPAANGWHGSWKEDWSTEWFCEGQDMVLKVQEVAYGRVEAKFNYFPNKCGNIVWGVGQGVVNTDNNACLTQTTDWTTT